MKIWLIVLTMFCPQSFASITSPVRVFRIVSTEISVGEKYKMFSPLKCENDYKMQSSLTKVKLEDLNLDRLKKCWGNSLDNYDFVQEVLKKQGQPNIAFIVSGSSIIAWIQIRAHVPRITFSRRFLKENPSVKIESSGGSLFIANGERKLRTRAGKLDIDKNGYLIFGSSHPYNQLNLDFGSFIQGKKTKLQLLKSLEENKMSHLAPLVEEFTLKPNECTGRVITKETFKITVNSEEIEVTNALVSCPPRKEFLPIPLKLKNS